MRDIRQIVVPVDFSDQTDKLVDYTAYIAGELSATTHFIHVIEFYPGNSMTTLSYIQQYEERLLADVRIRMSNLLEDNNERCTGCTGEVVIGEPVDKILEFAKVKGADLIIMATHGAKGLEKILLGSVAEHVLKGAHCPVLTMNPFKKRSR